MAGTPVIKSFVINGRNTIDRWHDGVLLIGSRSKCIGIKTTGICAMFRIRFELWSIWKTREMSWMLQRALHYGISYLIYNVISMSYLRQYKTRQICVCHICHLMFNFFTENVTDPIDILQDAWNKFSQEHHVIPVGCVIAGESNDITVWALITF